MSNLLEIKRGLMVKVDEIEALEYQDVFSTKVYTHHNTYDSDVPISTLEDMIEIAGRKYEVQEEEEKQPDLTKQFVAM